jgi:hypothetical protein
MVNLNNYSFFSKSKFRYFKNEYIRMRHISKIHKKCMSCYFLFSKKKKKCFKSKKTTLKNVPLMGIEAHFAPTCI